MFKLINKYRAFKTHKKAIFEEYQRQTERNYHDICFYNWWPIEDYTSLWLYRFVKNNGLCQTANKPIIFCSVFGDREVLSHVNDGFKIFFTGENLQSPQWAQYSDGLLEDKNCALSIGFDEFEDNRYLRFPLWLTYVFEPELDEKKIRERCEQLRYPTIGYREKFACLIARADTSGVRTAMYEGLKGIERIDCPSELFHNDESLIEQFEDDKVKYMQQYLFNICPENSNADGYCTEKVFEAIAAGCIPIYWGSYNRPEEKILNPNAIIFWDKDSDGSEAIHKIRELYEEPGKMKEFMRQPRLLPNAEEEIIRMMNELKNRITMLT